jgi:DNA-binding SARP family transcriptional activator/tetratricopeptide (TPR) repeat protein
VHRADSGNEKHQSRICLFGRMTVQIGGRAITPPGRQGRMLLAYLVANRSRPVRRDELIDVLWEGLPPANPEADLTTVLSRLRRDIGADLLPTRDLSLRLPEGAWVDLDVIDELGQQTLQALEGELPDEAVRLADETLALMEGELLPGLEAKWIDERRRELAELRLLVREASVEASLQLGGVRLRRAKGMAESLVEEAPYRESGHELLMRVHAAGGNFAEAHRAYHRLRILLMNELGTTPGLGITELNERLLRQEEVPHAPARGGQTPPAGPPAKLPEQIPVPPPLESVPDERFVGREEALARLWARWERVSYRPRAVALTGAPGIGKTRLAACFSRQVHGAGGTVLYGRCDEDPLTSYQPFVEALDHYAGFHDFQHELPQETKELRRLPGLRRRLHGADGNDHPAIVEDRYALFEAIVSVFRRAAQARPLLLVIDDVHWADAPTFSLLLYLARSLKPSRCMLLMTSRDADAHRPTQRAGDPAESLEARLASLRREAEVDRVCLEGLDEQQTAKLISARRGSAPSDVFARDLRGQTGGNPFFIEEALRSLVEREGPGGEPEPDLDRLGVPEGVEEVITRRLDRLSGSTSMVLARASVIGPEFPLLLLATIADLSPEAVLDEIEELIGDGLLVEVPRKRDEFAFAHALIRETQYRRLIASRRARIHARVAAELERRAEHPARGEHRVSPVELAHHFYEARPAVDPERAAHYSIEAAQHARRTGAYEEAIAHYGRALELLDSGSPDEMRICDLLLLLGKVELRAGRLDDAQRTFARAADIARRTGAVDRLALAALGFHGMYTPAGHVDQRRIDLLEEAQAALGPTDSPLRARVLARLADSVLWLARDRALELSGEAVAMARRLGDTHAIREALGGRHAALLHAEYLEERLGVSRERLDLATAAGNREAEAEAVRWYMADLCDRGEVRGAKEQYARLADIARELRQPQYSSYVSHWACVFAQLHGRLEEAERLADEGYELAKRAGAGDAEMTHLLKRFSIYREQGRVIELRPSVERFIANAPTLRAWRALGALMNAETGDTRKARAHLDRLVADGAAMIPRDVVWLYGVAALAETCALLDDTSEPAAVLYRLLQPYADHCVQVGMIVFWGSASRFLGLAAAARGDWDAADRHFSVATKRNQEIGSAPLVARTLVGHADMLLRRAERTDGDAASRLLERATSLAEPLGMVEVCRRAARLQARAGSSATLV